MSEKIKRDRRIQIRLTDAEHEELLSRMTGGELATWMRTVCLDEKPNKKRVYKVADENLLRALAKIGGNLNQIARQANTVQSELEKIKTFAELSVIRNQLQQVLENYDR